VHVAEIYTYEAPLMCYPTKRVAV